MAANTYSGFCEFVPQVCGQFVYMLFSLFCRSCYTIVLLPHSHFLHTHIVYNIHPLDKSLTLLFWIISLFYLFMDVLCSRQYHSSWSPLSEQLSSLYKRKREKYNKKNAPKLTWHYVATTFILFLFHICLSTTIHMWYVQDQTRSMKKPVSVSGPLISVWFCVFSLIYHDTSNSHPTNFI